MVDQSRCSASVQIQRRFERAGARGCYKCLRAVGGRRGAAHRVCCLMFAFFASASSCVCMSVCGVAHGQGHNKARHQSRTVEEEPCQSDCKRRDALLRCLQCCTTSHPSLAASSPLQGHATGHSPMQRSAKRKEKSMNLHPPILLWPGCEHSDQTERGRARGQQQHASTEFTTRANPCPPQSSHNTHRLHPLRPPPSLIRNLIRE
jgi:hypothetical protein